LKHSVHIFNAICAVLKAYFVITLMSLQRSFCLSPNLSVMTRLQFTRRLALTKRCSVCLCSFVSEVITIDDDVIDVDTCDSHTSESTSTTVSLDWNSAPSATVTRSMSFIAVRGSHASWKFLDFWGEFPGSESPGKCPWFWKVLNFARH